MATGKASDFKVNPDLMYGRFTEVLEQNAAAFNANARNAIRIVPERLIGDYSKESFMEAITALASRRDTTSTSSATDTALTQDEHIDIKINRKLGPIANTIDSLRKIGVGPDEFSVRLGEQIAKAIQLDYLNTALYGAIGALDKAATTYYDAADDLESVDLIDGLAKFGDAADRVLVWVMHSFSYFQLMKNQLAASIYNVSGTVIREGVPATLNRPVIVTDSAALISESATSDGAAEEYSVLGLTVDGLIVRESEERQIVDEVVTGLENLVYRIQGEYAFNLRVKGFAYDTSTTNPTLANLADSSKWTQAASDIKSCAGVIVKHHPTSAD